MLRELITEEEYRALDSRREEWMFLGNNPRWEKEIPIKEILSCWEENKINLFHLLGDKLIITKNINYSCGVSEKRRAMEQFIYRADEKWSGREFYDSYYNWMTKTFDSYHDMATERQRLAAMHLISTSALIKNTWDDEDAFEVPMPDGKTYKIVQGTKVMKALSKIATAYNLKGFEEFRIGHSFVLNDKQLSGNLTLSIHPLDYWTMSDNNCSWTSCMSWEDPGAFRLGTIEMMNSPCVIVAYLSSEEPFYSDCDCDLKWSNKKWRQLFIVDRGLIFAIKGYPYQQEHLEKQILYWIADLAKENLGWEYQPELTYYDNHNIYLQATGDLLYEDIGFETTYMYNDVGGLYKHLCLCGVDNIENHMRFWYSGMAQCLCCGRKADWADFASEITLSCTECDPVRFCSECNEPIYDGDYLVISDNLLCENCATDLTIVCNNCCESHWIEDTIKVFIVIDAERSLIFNEILYLCPDCYEALIEKGIPIYQNKNNCYYVMYQDMKNAISYLPWLLVNQDNQIYSSTEQLLKNCPYSLYQGNIDDLWSM